MSTQWQSEAPLPPYTDTLVGKPSSDHKLKGQDIQTVEVLPEAHVKGNDVRSPVITPVVGQVPLQTRAEIPSPPRPVEWQHIRTQLGLVHEEERRSERQKIRKEPRLKSHNDDGPVGVLKKFGQAFLILLTAPFFLCYALFELTGALLKGIGLLFTGLAKGFKLLSYWPGKGRKKCAMQTGVC